LLWQFLRALLSGASLQAAAQGLSLSEDAFRRAYRRLRCRLDALRAALCRERQPPPSTRQIPLQQTIEHLMAVFPNSANPLEEYQTHFQQPLMG
jgi:hypothetical protein